MRPQKLTQVFNKNNIFLKNKIKLEESFGLFPKEKVFSHVYMYVFSISTSTI